jgi:uncharacterized coiled-coil protein SlyX
MLLFIIAFVAAAVLTYLIIRKNTLWCSEKTIADLSDANYRLQKEIDNSRKKALQLQQSLQEVKESMEPEKMAR